jgi:hypothetical protein
MVIVSGTPGPVPLVAGTVNARISFSSDMMFFGSLLAQND